MAIDIPKIARPISEIIVHTTATRPEWWKSRTVNQKIKEIRRWHVEDRGWSDIGYHYVIDRDGKIGTARPLGRVGAHTKGHNTGSVGIALLGGFGGAQDDGFDAHYTPAQDKAARELITAIMAKHQIAKISGHNEYAAKACPCFDVQAWWSKSKPRPIYPAKPPTAPRAPVAPAPKAATGLAALIAQILASILKGRTK